MKIKLVEAQPELEESQALLLVKKAQVEKEQIIVNKQIELVEIETEKV